MTVTNSTGCANEDSIQITFIQYPIVNLGNDTSFCIGQSITLDATNIGSTYLWSTGANTQTISVNTTGNYAVTVTNSGICSATDNINITIVPLPVINLGNDTSLCAGQPISLNAGNGGSTFFWNNNLITQTISPTTSGVYSVTVTNATGCVSEDTIQVTFIPNPAINLGNDTTICAGQSVILNAANIGYNYLWSTGATTQTITVSTSGSFSVIVSNQMCNSTDTLVVTVVSLPVINLGNDTTLCFGQPTSLNAGNPGARYQWSNNEITQIIFPTTSGSYSVIVTNLSNCVATDSINITFIPYPIVELGSDTTLCGNQVLPLYGGSPATSYLWSDGSTNSTLIASTTGLYYVITKNGICISTDSINLTKETMPTVEIGPDVKICYGQSTILNVQNAGLIYQWNTGANTQSITATSSGEYWVKVSNNGCSSIDSVNVFVDNLIDVNLGPDTTVCPGDQIILTPDKQFIEYLWLPGNEQSSSIIVTQPGTYFVTVKDSIGCMASKSRLIQEFCPSNIFVPNTFTPNGDLLNNNFLAYGERIQYFNMQIFDRWGELIFQSNDLSHGWDGTYKGIACQQDIYVYRIDYKLFDGTELKMHTIYGNVNLIR